MINKAETENPTNESQSKKMLAGMIVTTVIAVLLAVGLALIGAVLFALGGGFGGSIFFSIMFFGPLLLIFPIIASWVFYAKKNTIWVKRMRSGIWWFLILDLIAIGLLVLYMFLISSGP